jgi:hypothetical protein
MNSPNSPISPEAIAFVVDAISAFSAIIKDERGGMLPQALVQNTAGKRSIVVVTAGSGGPGEPVTEADVETGRELLRKFRRTPDVIGMAALVYDSFLNVGGSRTSALVAEIIDGRTWHVLAQRYSFSGSQFLRVGRLAYLAGNSVELDV